MTITVFLGVAGGTGTTTAAIAHARRCNATVVDLDLVHGAVAFRCGVRVARTIADLASLGDEDITSVQVDALAYSAGRLRLIASPASPELAEIVPSRLVAQLVEILSASGPVVIDGGSRVDTCVLAALRLADEIVLVARPDTFCAERMRAMLNLFERASVRSAVRSCVPGAGRKVAASFAATVGLTIHPLERRHATPGIGSLRFTHRWRSHAGSQ